MKTSWGSSTQSTGRYASISFLYSLFGCRESVRIETDFLLISPYFALHFYVKLVMHYLGFLQEPWLIGLMGFYIVLLLITISSRKNINFQMSLFFLACKSASAFLFFAHLYPNFPNFLFLFFFLSFFVSSFYLFLMNFKMPNFYYVMKIVPAFHFGWDQRSAAYFSLFKFNCSGNLITCTSTNKYTV